MPAIPERNLVLEALEVGDVENNPRPYLGYSTIGEPCIRYLQYYHRMAFTSTISKRIRRLFDFGKYMEAVFEHDLSNIGIKVSKQQEEIIGFSGHWQGHIDGRLINVPGALKTEHLLESKTHNKDQFRALVKANSVKESHPKHYAQATAYMGKLKLTRALYLGYCKDDSDYYAERLYFDKELFKELEFKAKAVVTSNELFPRIGNGRETWHECRFCPAKQVCHSKVQAIHNCRTCQYVIAADRGKWICGAAKSKLHKQELTLELQQKTCDEYQLDEVLQ